MTLFSKNFFWGHDPFGPPGDTYALALPSEISAYATGSTPIF